MVSVLVFAKSRGVSHQAIRKRIKSGELIPAMAGGLINVVKANRILNDGTTVGDNIGTEVVAARKRKLVAKAQTLRTEVEATRSNVVERQIADEVLTAAEARARAAIMAIPNQIKFDTDLSGLDSNTIFRAIDKAVRKALTALAEPDEDEAAADAEDQLVDLDTLTPSELATLLNNLQADAIELAALIASGEAVRVDEACARFQDKLLRVRGRLLAVAGKVASVESVSPSALKAKLKAALSEALEEFSREPETPESEDDE